MPPNPIIKQVEKIFLNKLVELIENETISPIEGQTITKEFLQHVDSGNLDQFKTGLHQLTTTHADFKPVYSEFLRLEEQERVDSVLNKMQTLIKSGDVDGALSVAQTSGTQNP